jgi:hypothetical protein
VTSADLGPFLQRREVLAYEQRLARAVYAYGVDVRRAAWLQASTLGEPVMRAVDRRWNGMVAALAERLEPVGTALPSSVLEELTRLVSQLRTPLPTIRLLRPTESGRWPVITPLSTTRGGIQWLVVDVERLTSLPELERRFTIAAALAHLQCDHGPLFAAHLMADLAGRGASFVRAALRPWTRVAYFSADRGGLLLTGDAAPCVRALEITASDVPHWVPHPPSITARRQALEDFDRSEVMARVRLLSQTDPEQWAAAAALAAKSEGPMAKRIATMLGAAMRLGGKVAITLEGGSLSGPAGKHDSDAHAAGVDAKSDGDDTDAKAKASAKAPPPEPAPLDPEVARKIQEAIHGAWSVARCDQRLTRRLGLL